MQYLLDHLAATLVGSTVLLLLLAVSFRAGQSDTAAQLYESSRRLNQAFAQQLEGDLQNIGYGVPSSSAAISEWTPSRFAFRRKVDTTAAAPVVEIAYDRITVDSVLVRGATVPVYAVERTVDGVASGSSGPSLTDFDLALIARDGSVVADPTAAIGVAVSFRSAFGTQLSENAASASRFERTFYPANLDD